MWVCVCACVRRREAREVILAARVEPSKSSVLLRRMSRPNIALFFADDIPRNMLGAYGAEGTLSPHLSGLAKDGLTFEHAYTTAPLCTPSRFSLLTGRYASNASSIVSHRPWNLVGFNTFLTGSEPTMAHRLRRSGYATCFVGKVRALRQWSKYLSRCMTCECSSDSNLLVAFH